MSRYVDLSEKVTATFYDQECEEWTQQTVTVADVLDSVCDDYTVLPSAQPELCEDAVSRADVVDMLEMYPFTEYGEYDSAREAVKRLPSAQPASYRQVTGKLDCVSRQAEIDAWKADFKGYVDSLDLLRDDYNGIMEYIDETPSAQPDIIRCKDCKYQDEGYRRISVKWLPCMDLRPGSNWYCGSAERQEE